MKIHQELGDHTPEVDSVLTIGVFDGVHGGHRHLISHLKAEAGRMGLLAGIVTFRNHPISVLRPDLKPRFLTGLQERLSLLREMRVDFIAPISFDLDVSRLGAMEFVCLLQDRLKMKGLVIGPDFAMGRGREADGDTLTSMGKGMGFSVKIIEPFAGAGGRPVKSSAVREALARGDVEGVAAQLGRNFSLTGTVVSGAARGGPLGFPTANLQIGEDMAVTGDGIYATWVQVGSRRYMAATSIGMRPTFEGSGHAVEAYLLDFEGDLYGQQVRLEFVRRLRGEERFNTVSDLQKQIHRDVGRTRQILHSVGAAG